MLERAGPMLILLLAHLASTPIVLAGGLDHPQALDVDDTHVYFATLAGIFRAPKDGGDFQMIFSGRTERAFPYRLAVEGERVYFAAPSKDPGKYLIRSAPKAGGPAVELLNGDGIISGFGVDATGVYWTDWLNKNVSRMPVGGGRRDV